MALGAPPKAWFCTATWPVFAPPLTDDLFGGEIAGLHGGDQF